MSTRPQMFFFRKHFNSSTDLNTEPTLNISKSPVRGHHSQRTVDALGRATLMAVNRLSQMKCCMYVPQHTLWPLTPFALLPGSCFSLLFLLNVTAERAALQHCIIPVAGGGRDALWFPLFSCPAACLLLKSRAGQEFGNFLQEVGKKETGAGMEEGRWGSVCGRSKPPGTER